MPKNRKTVGVLAPYTLSCNKTSVEPSNDHRSGQVSQHINNKILGRKGGIYQIGGRSQTKQGSS